MTRTMTNDLRTALVLTLFFTVLCGLIYPFAMTGVALGVFPHQAKGSVIERDGTPVGSSLIGQTFEGPEYFRGRPSAAGDGYDASASSGSNLGPTSAALLERVTADVDTVRSDNGLASDADVPADAVTTSASGLDPHISPAYAELQVARVAKERGMTEDAVRALVKKYTDTPFLTIGEARVNVLLLNLALDDSER